MTNHLLIAPSLLYVRYTGAETIATMAFDADGGTDTDGLLTLASGTTSSTTNCAAYTTLATLVAAVNLVDDWEARPYWGLATTTVTEKTALGTQRPLADTASVSMLDKLYHPTLTGTNTYEVLPASATTALLTALAVQTDRTDSANLVLNVDGADAGATGDATFNFISNPAGELNVARNWSSTQYWDTVSIDDNMIVAINGSTEAQYAPSVDISCYSQIKLLSVINADDAVLKVWGSLNY